MNTPLVESRDSICEQDYVSALKLGWVGEKRDFDRMDFILIGREMSMGLLCRVGQEMDLVLQ